MISFQQASRIQPHQIHPGLAQSQIDRAIKQRGQRIHAALHAIAAPRIGLTRVLAGRPQHAFGGIERFAA